MRATLERCRERGVRIKLRGRRIAYARRLKGGWYENRASDFTLKFDIKDESTEAKEDAYFSIVRMENW